MVSTEIAKGGIYALNFCLSEAALLGIFIQLKAWRTGAGGAKGLRICALSFGLGMANHWTSQVVLLPGFGLLLAEPWWRSGKLPGLPRGWIREGAWSALLLACGFSLYLFLPLRSLLHPVLQWGEPWTLSGFWWVFNRSQYAFPSRPARASPRFGCWPAMWAPTFAWSSGGGAPGLGLGLAPALEAPALDGP